MSDKAEEKCPTCNKEWADPNGRFCSNSWHLATPLIYKELASLREQLKEKQQQLDAVLRNSTKLMDQIKDSHLNEDAEFLELQKLRKQLKQKEDENRELIDMVNKLLQYRAFPIPDELRQEAKNLISRLSAKLGKV